MEKNNLYSTLVEATRKLKDKGYKYDFSVSKDGFLEILGEGTLGKISPSQTKLVEFHRFEGMSNPSDMSIIYALETSKGLKGTIIDSYGSDGSKRISDFVNEVKQQALDN